MPKKPEPNPWTALRDMWKARSFGCPSYEIQGFVWWGRFGEFDAFVPRTPQRFPQKGDKNMAAGVPETGRTVQENTQSSIDESINLAESRLNKVKSRLHKLKPLLDSVQGRYSKLKTEADSIQEQIDLLRQGQLELEVKYGNA